MTTQVAGHPRNGLRHGRWYATVEKQESEEDDSWVVFATDADWETKYVFYYLLMQIECSMLVDMARLGFFIRYDIIIQPI